MQYHLLFNNEAAGKDIKWGRGDGDGIFGKNQDLKEWGWRSILSCRELYTTLFKTNRLFTPVCIAGSRIVTANNRGEGVMDTAGAIYFLIYIYIIYIYIYYRHVNQ